MNRHLNNEWQEWKPGHAERTLTGGGGGEQRKEIKKVNMVDVYISYIEIYKNEYRIFKPIEIIIRRGLR
jgi:hypothetical protein